MLSETAAAVLQHWQEHYLVYVGFTFATFTWLAYTAFLRVRFFSPTRNYPGPGHGHWLMGHVYAFTREPPGHAQLRWHRQYGSMIRFRGPLPGRESLSFTSYSALKTILVDRAYEFPKPAFLRDVLGIAAGYGLLTLEGPDHQSMRRFMNQAFAFKYLQEQFDTYYKPINSLVDILSQKIQAEEDPENKEEGIVIGIDHYLNNCLMDIICLTAFGYECDSLHNEHQPLANAYYELVNLQNGKNLIILSMLLAIPFGPVIARRAAKRTRGGQVLHAVDQMLGKYSPQPLKIAESFFRNLAVVNSVSTQLLEEKMAEARELKKAGTFSIDGSGAKVDILSLLVRASLDDNSPYKMNTEMLQHQMLTFLGAGHETTASGAAWAIWELSSRPEIQKKLRRECQELIARNSTPGYQEIKQLRYLHCFIQEVLRLRPPTPATARQASKDSTVDGVFIPKGTGIYIPNRCVNQDKNVWGEDADEFKPERWFDLPKEHDSNFSLLTFIAGPHHCIGRQMSLLELKALLCVLVAHFEFIQAQDPPKEEGAITMKPVGGLQVRIRKLDPADSIKTV